MGKKRIETGDLVFSCGDTAEDLNLRRAQAVFIIAKRDPERFRGVFNIAREITNPRDMVAFIEAGMWALWNGVYSGSDLFARIEATQPDVAELAKSIYPTHVGLIYETRKPYKLSVWEGLPLDSLNKFVPPLQWQPMGRGGFVLTPLRAHLLEQGGEKLRVRRLKRSKISDKFSARLDAFCKRNIGNRYGAPDDPLIFEKIGHLVFGTRKASGGRTLNKVKNDSTASPPVVDNLTCSALTYETIRWSIGSANKVPALSVLPHDLFVGESLEIIDDLYEKPEQIKRLAFLEW